jgi:SAM-dependent methyltransferase
MSTQKKTGWDQIYSDPKSYTYYNLHKAHEHLDKIIQFFTQNSVSKILDLGCGLGRNMIPLLRKGFNIYGIDNSKNGIAFLALELKKQKLKTNLKVGKFQNLPYPDNYFDAVLSVQTLNHGYEVDVKKGIREIERVLKPYGCLFLTVPGRISKGEVRYCLVKTATQVEPFTFIPTIGDEIGIPHYIFNKKLIGKHLRNFTILSLWKDSKDYYCILAKKRR